MSAQADSRQAASTLSDPPEQGTLAYAYRRSVVALQSVFGGNTDSQYAEREPLLNGQDQQDNNGAASASNGGYGAVASSSRTDSSSRARIRKPKKVVSQSKVEAKVWFANERTWISWLRVSILIGSFALALFNSDTFFKNHNDHHPGHKSDYLSSGSIKAFGAVYAGIAVLTLLWGLYSYQRRVTLIKTKYPGNFDDLIGPPLICAALFIAVLLNFIIRVKQHDYESHH
ncbi:vacuole fusion non-autophagic-related protein [Pseudozyma hubeiensis SY62]|uniref:Vacuole fusion non-autophagic-related protein n=1 Tax=Pseudozyma hubeiensis (strain SY62) TaxID=1305764 RepID=R9PCQ4_PSEHS|nr:vacuole fusion non-autophagic-related protein [Pseudozyma hubeiensis SY62]GAC99151.1 vacuole fusion non-autophagic-related protein [Pseudozyma hubeiensis SY62]